MPIDIDNTDVSDITIDGQNVSEVTADGNVVWNAIPDSVVYQVRAEDFSDPWPFDVGGIDMTVNGLVGDSFSNGETSVIGGGNDYGIADGPQNLPENETFGVALTPQMDTGNGMWFGPRDGDTDFFIRSSSGAQPDGGFDLTLDDGSGTIRVYSDNTYADGNPHAVIINKTGATASDIEIFVDDMSTTVSTTIFSDSGFDHTAYSNATPAQFWRFSDGSSGQVYQSGHLGVFEFWDAPLDQSDRDDFVSRRPEV